MSQHPSFGGSSATTKHRSVLKRYEKLEVLKTKGIFDEEAGVLGLPKVKVLKIKAKKKSTATDKEKDGDKGKAAASDKPSK